MKLNLSIFFLCLCSLCDIQEITAKFSDLVYLLVLLSGMLCIGLLDLVGFLCCSSPVSLLTFSLIVLSITESRVLHSPAIPVVLNFAFQSVNFCFMYFDDLLSYLKKFLIALLLNWNCRGFCVNFLEF